MPTGYTSELYDGKDQTFPEFALNCARAFGALVELRDSPTAAIPDEFEPSNYHSKAVSEAKEMRAWLAKATTAECTAAAVAAADEWDEQRKAERAKRDALEARYRAMLAEVEAWEPPTPDHVGLAAFMQQQLNESIKFDCGTYTYPEPTRDGEQWRAERLAKVERDITYHSEEFAKEQDRAASRTLWIRELRASLAGSFVEPADG